MSFKTYLGLKDVALLEDLSNDVLLPLGSELVFELAVGSRIKLALVSVPVGYLSAMLIKEDRVIKYLLVGNKDLPAVDDLCQWSRLVGLPVSDSLCRVYNDDKVIVGALVVDLDLSAVSVHVCV